MQWTATTISTRLVALDVDGTLARHGSPIDPAVLGTLREVADRGVQVVIATGRGWLNMRDIVRLLPPSAYLVLNNGSSTRVAADGRLTRMRVRFHIRRSQSRSALDLSRGRSSGHLDRVGHLRQPLSGRWRLADLDALPPLPGPQGGMGLPSGASRAGAAAGTGFCPGATRSWSGP